ncbi:MAG: helix-turn-helix transcriptional regulator [Cyanothece sp. SIO1E1]|nr:helix-turn-helix transcriptional regulator [Cyanothece sp. SIO1E1]
MAMKNKIKEFLDGRGITVYKFRQDTGLANKTAYDLYNNPFQYPAKGVMEKICKTYKIQPGILLEWVPDTEVAS